MFFLVSKEKQNPKKNRIRLRTKKKTGAKTAIRPARAHAQNPVLDRCHFPLQILHKIGVIWLETVKRGHQFATERAIVDHGINAVRNHAKHTQGYGSVFLDFSMSVYWNLWIWFLLQCAIRKTEWAHKVNCTYRIPEGNYKVHTAFLKLDLSGLWVWTPN